MGTLDKLDGPKRKEGLPSTEQLVSRVNKKLEEDFVRAARLCAPRPTDFQRKISAIQAVREITGASLPDAKVWVESHKLWTPA